MNLECERCIAEISLENLKYNYLKIKEQTKGEVMAVIKADAYGHGAAKCAKALESVGADGFAVATVKEALDLKSAGIKGDILILGAVPAPSIEYLLESDIIVSLPSLKNARAYAEHIKSGRLRAHIKLDTGMNRHGISSEDPIKACCEIEELMAMEEFSIEGIFTHLCAADMANGKDFTLRQTELFKNVNDLLMKKGIALKKHCANSAGILSYPQTHFDMSRAGIILYGVNFDRLAPNTLGLRPVMSFKSQITQIKKIHKGDTVGYSRSYTSESDRLIATVSVGYADGLARACSGKISMLIRGLPALQIGNICMDITMVDVTDIKGVSLGDEVTVFGSDGKNSISVEQLAYEADTIPYEILTGISARVPRVYR